MPGIVAAVDTVKLLDRIEEAAIDGDVVEALLLCQKLGGDADSLALRNWAKRELEGYPAEVSPPEYRRVRGQLLGDGAAPGQRLTAVPIPMEALPEASRQEWAQGIPLWNSITEIEKRSHDERFRWTPSSWGRMLEAINERNQSLVMFDHVYFAASGSALGGVVTAVRSRMVGLVAHLRSSLPDGSQLDPNTASQAVSEVITGTVVNVTGDNNEVVLGTDKASISTISNAAPTDSTKRKLGRWAKGFVEALVTVATVVSLLWGDSFNLL